MADSTTVNGIVLQTPYAYLKNFVRVRPFMVSVVGIDPRLNQNANNLRAFRPDYETINTGIIVYVGDKIHFDLQAPCNDATAPAFDLIRVNPSTGIETTQETVYFTAKWQRSMVITVTAINASTGAITYTAAYR
jgi:hypothetical protein